ncbi:MULTISPECIES: bifunctional histidinol-phosphatase/imidazoleglycerol-phosphate dehydratase HisB [unclassified Mucilaginibacter]|uniref:bifunctional histidinol-phosphatase/imidazoleglycerol-phosphate dehydratase HisB n=1 Tax=unclassified Mucilaginibacter TaxID=2617802 RepID=UPI002AC945D6|nr:MULTISPECIES: bifunctional histidinol-phosphatase/imidazoleglycerol-phosphate dehydratase HisB [unclassified Mucilaginibacter]MEB0263319.1 bifunctional histidinol-phosphatase/imidazoleglycerol-phosphate dehydratase HisB [Mucilaginibacter sp. 10I4]MEB0280735.1 bifunctional histidinol-phosphatase/imidazoleglycerol-phosphate dehydratase HisB [Mucilaginibacter sp. 10B2]MEB0301452.1 bifunctional histidinol-phosphatase/imidazoleglycerol-phosphate dehydratase HisB [Mucilaginibacter sp. 5C4]WPX22676
MSKLQKVLFIDRDGTIINETPDEQIDSFAKLTFYPGALQYLPKIAAELDFELVMVTNQDGLGTAVYPEDTFYPVHNFILKTFENEGVHFSDQAIDRTFPADNAPTRKPATGLLTKYLDATKYDLVNSFTIGDRKNDVLLAKNLGAKAIWLNNKSGLGDGEFKTETDSDIAGVVALQTIEWNDIYEFLKLGQRVFEHSRVTKETDIRIKINLDGTGEAKVSTGLHFFDHMLDQIARHGSIDLEVTAKGDLHIDEHHTIEDTGIALGEIFATALGNKMGIERYGFCLPMDDCLAQAAIDFGGRNWIVWDAVFNREKVGDVPTEMFYHFFKSFSDASKCNLNIKAEGQNEHHKIEAIFKAFAKAIKMAVKRDVNKMVLPSTKGLL